MMLNFAESGHLYFVPQAPWKEKDYEAKNRKISLFTSTVAKKTLN